MWRGFDPELHRDWQVIQGMIGRQRQTPTREWPLIFDEESEQFFDAPGNLGAAKHMFARLTLDAPLNRYVNGLRVRFNGTVRRTRVEDPISGEMRNFSDFYPDWEWSFDVRRDSGPWSYGFVVSDRDRFTFFRTDELHINYNN